MLNAGNIHECWILEINDFLESVFIDTHRKFEICKRNKRRTISQPKPLKQNAFT